MSEKDKDKPEEKKKGDEEKQGRFVGAYIPEEQAVFLDCIIAADTHLSKSDIVRKALDHYIETALPNAVKEGAEQILKTRRKTLKAIGKESG